MSLHCKLDKYTPVYIKAYTISRCVNSCGKSFSDCSCNARCKKSGDCCSDFQFCEIVEESHTTESVIPNCKFSTTDKSTCLQCKDNFFYYNNSCISTCSSDTLVNKANKICIDRDGCTAPHCEKCSNDISSVCSKCVNGFFLCNGECLVSCPVGLRANRVNFTCQQVNEFSFYWIFPSKYGCKEKCGEHNIQLDCSCRHTCFRRGNCCDDFEKECKAELRNENCKLCSKCLDGKCSKCKENSEENASECRCKQGFEYDIQEDICYQNKRQNEDVLNKLNKLNKINQIDKEKETGKNEIKNVLTSDKKLGKISPSPLPIVESIIKPNSTLVLKKHIPIPIPVINYNFANSTNLSINDSHNFDINNNTLAEELLKSFKNMNTWENQMKNQSRILNLYMTGNITFNIITGNTNPQLITQNIYNQDSYNTIQVGNLNSSKLKKRVNNTLHNITSNRNQIIPNLHTHHEKNFEQKNVLSNSLNVQEDNSTNTNYTLIAPINIKNISHHKIHIDNDSFFENENETLSAKSDISSNITFDFLGDPQALVKNPIHNTYYITDNSIKIMNPPNPSVIKIDRGNNSLLNNTEYIIINNNQSDVSSNEDNSTTTIIINRNKKSMIKNITDDNNL